MDNTINTNRNTLKEHMDMLFVFSSKVLYNLDHPLPIIEASKSLIGLDIDNPSRNLLKWIRISNLKMFIKQLIFCKQNAKLSFGIFFSLRKR